MNGLDFQKCPVVNFVTFSPKSVDLLKINFCLFHDKNFENA
jgi:hypothetical protein